MCDRVCLSRTAYVCDCIYMFELLLVRVSISFLLLCVCIYTCCLVKLLCVRMFVLVCIFGCGGASLSLPVYFVIEPVRSVALIYAYVQ